MLDSNTIEVIRKYEKTAFVVIVLGVACVCFVSKLIYNKKEWNELLYKDYDFENITNYTDLILKLEEKHQKLQKIVNIIKKIQRINKEQTVFNEGLFELFNYQSLIIVIEVQNDTYRLAKLLQSLENVTAISKAVLIFAHNYYNERINSIVESVEFAKYMQIFYPYSSQLYPTIFPGNDSRFCSTGYFCQNSYKRNYVLAQKKLFWWWYVRHVFDVLEETSCIEHFILFLRSDQIVTEDVLYLLHVLSSTKFLSEICPQCSIINLGAYEPDSRNYHVNDIEVVIGALGDTEKNMGIAFNRSFWNKVKAHYEAFCEFNDYRWDESLTFVGTKLPLGEVCMMSPAGPRVLSTGCGEEDDDSCDAVEKVENMTKFVKQIKRGLFPRNVIFKTFNFVMKIMPAGFFDDVRDIDLCKFILSDSYLKLNDP